MLQIQHKNNCSIPGGLLETLGISKIMIKKLTENYKKGKTHSKSVSSEIHFISLSKLLKL